jgi:hypothetical protein
MDRAFLGDVEAHHAGVYLLDRATTRTVCARVALETVTNHGVQWRGRAMSSAGAQGPYGMNDTTNGRPRATESEEVR